jgi:hypothetical protein
LTISVPASGGVGTYCDITHTASIGSTDAFYFALVNGSGSGSGTINSVSIMTSLPSGATGMVIFGLGGQTMANNSSLYFNPFVGNSGSGTETAHEFPMPRALTASNLNCYVTTAPLTSANNITVRQNAASPPSGLTVNLALLTTGLIQDTSHTISFANKDLFDLLDNQSSGTAPAVSSCSMQVD